MKKDVLIHIRGKVTAEGSEPDVIELMTDGRYYGKDGKYYIIYKETEASGYKGAVTTLKVEGEDCVTMIRRGPAQANLILEQGLRHLCRYETGEGELMVGISDCRIHSGLGERGGDLKFRYSLDINSNLVSHNEVSISVREAGKSNDRSIECGN